MLAQELDAFAKGILPKRPAERRPATTIGNAPVTLSRLKRARGGLRLQYGSWVGGDDRTAFKAVFLCGTAGASRSGFFRGAEYNNRRAFWNGTAAIRSGWLAEFYGRVTDRVFPGICQRGMK